MKKYAFFALSLLFLTFLVIVIFGNPSAIAQDRPVLFPDQPREPQPAVWPDEPGAMPALIGGKKAERPMLYGTAADANNPQSTEAISISFWYGDNQKFGDNGDPQQWINILGNVSSTTEIVSLSYRLNGGDYQPLSIGPSSPVTRLINAGDFNIEIDHDDPDLVDGLNTVDVKALDKNGSTLEESVDFTYSAGNTWQLPYDADWGSSSNIQDIAQVVDGKWAIQEGKLIPLEVGYDRLVAIGEETWDEYEVTAAITVNSLDNKGFEGVSNGPAIGFIMRWQGHTQTPDPSPPEQPRLDWVRSGALGWYRWAQKDGPEGLELRSKNAWMGSSSEKVWEFGVPYFLKMSVQNAPGSSGGQAYYRLKFWPQGGDEPAEWDIEGFNSEADSPAGSVILVAHHVNVEFGLVQIRDLSALNFSLSTNVNGQGEVATDPPGQTQFAYGERVFLYPLPLPGSGYIFDGWSGDFTGNDDPLVVYMTKDINVTANFVEPIDGVLDVTVVGEGTVTKDPDETDYTGGDMVTLVATPKEGHRFKEWSGDLSGTQNPATIKISGDKSVLATFEPTEKTAPYSDNFAQCELDENLWSIVNPAEDGGTAMIVGTALQLNVPSGDPHTMWGDNRDAIRIMQDVSDPDFLIEVKFDTIPAERVQLQGILVEQDEDNWLRFDFFNNGGGVVVFAGGTIGGSPVIESSIPIDADGSKELFMRVNRADNTWTQSYSFDGSSWKVAKIFPRNMAVNKMGIFAGNEPSQQGASAPAFAASVDYIKNISYPEGGFYSVDINTVGQGEVIITPESSEYACGQDVELEAIPNSGWSFQGWSGDLTGNSNPVTVKMDADKSIIATFVTESDILLFLPNIMRP